MIYNNFSGYDSRDEVGCGLAYCRLHIVDVMSSR